MFKKEEKSYITLFKSMLNQKSQFQGLLQKLMRINFPTVFKPVIHCYAANTAMLYLKFK